MEENRKSEMEEHSLLVLGEITEPFCKREANTD